MHPPSRVVSRFGVVTLRLELILDILNGGFTLGELLEDIETGGKIILLGTSEATLLQQAFKTSSLLGNIILVLLNLLKNLAVIFSIRILDVFACLLDLLLDILEIVTTEIDNNIIQRLYSASGSIQATTNNTMRPRLLIHERHERILLSRPTVIFRSSTLPREKFNRRITRDAKLLRHTFVRLGIHLRDRHAGLRAKILRHLLPRRLQTLTMPTPRRGERHEDIAVFPDRLLEVLIRKQHDLARQLRLPLGLDARLLLDELLETLEVPPPAVVDRLLGLAVEPLQRREPADAVLGRELLVRVAVHLGDVDALGRGVGVAELVVGRRQALAVAAPGGEELDEGGRAAEDGCVEVVGREVGDGEGGEGGEECKGEGAEVDHFAGIWGILV